jgi:NADPH-dependent 2,4-dienoyl-CoA reductase/sulfur reductase-like enzyme
MPERLAVIGGDAAGMTAASQARRMRDPEDLSIVAFEKGPYTSYSACGIPYLVGGVVEEVDELIVRSPEQFAERDIEAHTNHEVTAIDLERREVTVRDLENKGDRTEGFDQLMIATGATPRQLEIPNWDAEGIFGVQTIEHGAEIERFVEERKPGRAVVVGGGYIGLEMAEAFKSRGMETTCVELASQPMTMLDPDMGRIVGDAMRDIGIEVHTHERVVAFEVNEGEVDAVVTENMTIETDIVVLGLGVAPNSVLAEKAGLEIGESGGIVVDRRMQTSVDGVWSAGDCAEKFHLVSRKPVSIALGTHANKEGRVAGINIAGGHGSFPGVVGTAVSKVCDLEVAATGLNEKDAADAGFKYVTATVDSSTRAGYFPNASAIRTKIVCEKRSGRLLGAQIVGREGAAKRIDVLATALWNEMTVDEMLNLDLSYAPPFAPVWDPVLITAREAWDAVQEDLATDSPSLDDDRQ